MVVAASKAIGAWVDEDAELNSFLSDAQLRLFLYVSVDWFQRFLLVFLGLTQITSPWSLAAPLNWCHLMLLWQTPLLT